ncbi:MAG: DUF502 domain-containing protein [Flavobacteriales bacterium]|nr:DUF502 domain-containing protein [Flavobacteriales bacterium]
MFKYFLKRFGAYFLQGVLLAAPVAATIYVVYKLFTAIDSIIPFDVPGLGLLALILLLTLLGFFGTTIIAVPVMAYFKRLLDKAPLLKSIYSAVKDLTTAFMGKKKSFTEPVLVKMMIDSDVQKFGFITNKDLSELGISDDKVAVYLPHSYAFSGNLFIVPKRNVTPIDAKAADVMKFIVSGGVTSVDNE